MGAVAILPEHLQCRHDPMVSLTNVVRSLRVLPAEYLPFKALESESTGTHRFLDLIDHLGTGQQRLPDPGPDARQPFPPSHR